jgi:plastocyanin
MRLRFLAALPLCITPMAAIAADLDLKLVDAAGAPVADAVVTVKQPGGARGPISFPWGTTMTQQDIAFAPHVLIVPVGATVRFPNKDKVRHHVYSFSKPAKFEIKLFGKDETRSYTFTTAGAVALGCNIHDRMSGYIKVVDTPFAVKSGATGQAKLTGLPAGPAQVTVWHPRMKAKDNELTLSMPAGTARTVKLAVRAAQ